MQNNIKTYIRSNTLPFSEVPFGAVDALILSWFSYMELPGELFTAGMPVIRDCFRTEYFDELLRSIHYPEDSLELLDFAAASPRFRDIRLSDYAADFDADAVEQFSAVAFHISDSLIFAAFRGTDNSLTGWQEDFNLSLGNPVPSQLEAVEYVERLHRLYPQAEILAGGHSKGGNLAVYSSVSANAEVRNSITGIYSFDGPGFSDEFLKLGSFLEAAPRIQKYIPQSSMIGSLFGQESEYSVVHSDEFGFLQHNPFSWEVSEGNLKLREKLTPEAEVFCRSMNQWLAKLSPEERRRIINTIFEVLRSTGASDFNEFGSCLRKNLMTIVKSTADLDRETRSFVIRQFCGLAALNLQNMPVVLQELIGGQDERS